MALTGLCLPLIYILSMAAGEPDCYSCVYMQAGDPSDSDNTLQRQVDGIFRGVPGYDRNCFEERPDNSLICGTTEKCVMAKGTATNLQIRGSVTARGCYREESLPSDATANTCFRDDEYIIHYYNNIINDMFGRFFTDASGDVCLCNSNLCNTQDAHRLLSCHSCFYVMVGESGSETQAMMNDMLSGVTINEGPHTEQCQDDMAGNQVIQAKYRACHYREAHCIMGQGTARLNANKLKRDHYQVILRGCDAVHEVSGCLPSQDSAAYIREKLYGINEDNFGVSSDTAGHVCTCNQHLCNIESVVLSGARRNILSLWTITLLIAGMADW